MSPVFVTTLFLVQKALKTANSEKCVFSCQASNALPGPPNSLVFRRKPAPDVRRAPNSVFCPEKPANSSPLNSSPLVTASSPLAFWVQKCAKPGPVPKLLLRRVFCGPTARRVQARSPTARRIGPSAHRACHHSRRSAPQQRCAAEELHVHPHCCADEPQLLRAHPGAYLHVPAPDEESVQGAVRLVQLSR